MNLSYSRYFNEAFISYTWPELSTCTVPENRFPSPLAKDQEWRSGRNLDSTTLHNLSARSHDSPDSTRTPVWVSGHRTMSDSILSYIECLNLQAMVSSFYMAHITPDEPMNYR